MPETYDLPEDLPPVLQELLDYWLAVSDRTGVLPTLSDINLMELYRIAPRLFIGDRVRAENGNIRYRWRFWGTTLSIFVGADLTGKFLNQTHDEKATAAAIKYYEWALENGKPHHYCQGISVVGSENTYWEYERLIVPVADKTGQPGHIMGVYVSDQEDSYFKPERVLEGHKSYSFRDI